ncbi:MAG: hypothetical protein AB1733_09680 [Thermodesulfobacteriota bacterium]
MKYFVFLVLIVAVFTLLLRAIRDSQAPGAASFFEQIRQLGRNFHIMVGLVALLLLAIAVLRLIYYSFTWE